MNSKNRSNLQSPRAVRHPCDPDDLDGWFRRDDVFSGEPHDGHGFVGAACEVIQAATATGPGATS
jgi:hypothetical protein